MPDNRDPGRSPETGQDPLNQPGDSLSGASEDISTSTLDRPSRRTPRSSPAKGAPIPRGKHKPKKKRSAWIELPILVVVAVLVAILVRTFLLQTFYIPSPSMEKTLLVGDRVLVNKVVYKTRDPERGEVVVFKPPAAWIHPDNEDDFIKRIIGVGGDHVVCCDIKGRITINGYALNENYLFPGNVPSQRRFDVTVPSNRYFMLGDHRAVSGDSRYNLNANSGTIPKSAIVGRAFAIYWPLNRIDNLPIPSTLKRVPDPPGS